MTAYFLTYLLLFFLPGFLLVRLMNCRRFDFLLSFALSYVLLLANLFCLMLLHAPVYLFGAVLALELALLAGWWFLKRGVRGAFRAGAFGRQRRWRARGPAWLILGGLLAVLLGYLWYAGPYAEIPADAWGHLQRVQEARSAIRTGYFSAARPEGTAILHQGNYWYLLVAWICERCRLDTAALLWSLTVANVVTFVLGYFYLALYVFRGVRCARWLKYAVGAAASLFAAASMGVNVFAYIRYYALAPAILNYVLCLTAMLLLLSYLGRKEWFGRELVLAVFIVLAMKLVHSQEVLFAACMALGVIICEFWRRPSPKITALFWLGLIAYVGAFLLAHLQPMKAAPDALLLPVQQIIPFLKNMYLVPPTGRFYEVLTLWGVLVYLLFFIRLRFFARQPFILAGMFLPLLTLFNPFTVDLLLRIGVTSNALYRLGYLLPLPLVAGFLAVESGRVLCTGRFQPAPPAAATLKPAACPAWGIFRRVLAAAVLAGLVGCLFPIHSRYLEAPYSRCFTLRRIPPANTEKIWADLLEFLSRFDDKHIITDRVTGYVIRGWTLNSPCTGWFHDSAHDWWLQAAHVPWRGEELLAELAQRRDCSWLLVINERDGGYSGNGAISGHWPGDVLKVSRYYAPKMKAYVAEHPEHFQLLWSADRIRVYSVVIPLKVES